MRQAKQQALDLNTQIALAREDHEPWRRRELLQRTQAAPNPQAGAQELQALLFDLHVVQARRIAPVPVRPSAAHATRQPIRVCVTVSAEQIRLAKS